MADPRWPYRPLLDLIGKAEGTDAPKGRGYNETLAYGAYTDGPVNLVGMTLGEIDALQTRMLRHPKNKWNSSAIGRYQIVRTTLRSIKERLELKDSERFDEAMQDRLGCFLLGKRGVDRMLAGTMSDNAFINALAKEWASFPKTSGKGHYSGQGTGVTLAAVRAAIAEVRERAGRQQPPPPPPVEPPAADPHAIIAELHDLLDRLDAALAARPASLSPGARLAAAPAHTPIVAQPQETTTMFKRLFRDPRAVAFGSFAAAAVAHAFGVPISADQVVTIVSAAAERWESIAAAAVAVGGVWERWSALRGA